MGVRQIIPFVVGVLVVLLAVPDVTHAQLTAEQQDQIAQLRSELAQVEDEIAAAERDARAATSNLTNSLVGARLWILSTAADLIQQRMNVLEGGARVNTGVNRSEVTPETAATVLQDMETQVSKMADAVALFAASSPGIARAEPGFIVTIAKFSSVQTGMPLVQVERIIGAAGVETSRSDIAGFNTVAYEWRNADGSKMDALFQDGELIQKTQLGLR